MTTYRVAELCAGYGGIGLGLELAGVAHQVVWFAETDPHAARVFQTHHRHAPNLGDITRIGGDAVEPVDIVTAGFP